MPATVERDAARERVHIERTRHDGRDFVAIRVFFLSESGEWFPSPKRGVNLRLSAFAPGAWRDLKAVLEGGERADESEEDRGE